MRGRVCCKEPTGFYLGVTCPYCGKPFRVVMKDYGIPTPDEFWRLHKMLEGIDEKHEEPKNVKKTTDQ